MTDKPSTDVVPHKAGEIDLNRPDPFADLATAFDDGSQLYREHFGLSLPRLRSDFGRNGHGWIDDLTGDIKGELRIVILAYPPSRVFWIKGLDEGGGGTPPDCRSLDMIRPEPDSPALQSDTCASCPHSQWKTDSNGERIRPACSEAVNVIAYDVADTQFVWLRFAGTALRPFNNYVSALRSKRIWPFAVETEVKLEQQTRDRLEWLVPKFQIGRPLEVDEARPLREMAKLAMEQFRQVATEMAQREEGGAASTPAKPWTDDDTVTEAEVVDEQKFSGESF